MANELLNFDDNNLDKKYEINEIKIPTSYGHISAKTWNNGSNKLKVLAVHGWQDNAGTFDELLPLLETLNSMYVVAIDLPGHGKSSHLPKGIPYTDLTWTIAIKHVLDYLKWKSNVIIIAHSMGALASLDFASLFPEYIDKLIMIDTIKPRIYDKEMLAKESMENISTYLRSEHLNMNQNKIYQFDIEKAIDIIIQTHFNGKLNKQNAKCLLKRAVKFQNNGNVIFGRDHRLNTIVRRKFEKNQLKNYLMNLKCNLMIIRSKQTHHTLRCKYDNEFIDYYKQKCSKFIYHEIDGDHYIHLNSPQNISKSIDEFINDDDNNK